MSINGIKVRNLIVRYPNGHLAIDDLSINIAEGEVLCLLGPNGAGKSTFVSTLCGLQEYAGGSVHICGVEVTRQNWEARKFVGLVPQDICLEPLSTVYETVRFSRRLKGLRDHDGIVMDVLNSLELGKIAETQIMKLSGGMKRRVMIAKALAHEPKVVFLDEPTTGIDVPLRRMTWKLIERLSGLGTTIILTTHNMEEADYLSDKIVFIHEGKIIREGTPEQLRELHGKQSVTIEYKGSIAILPPILHRFSVDNSGSNTKVTHTVRDTDIRYDVREILRQLECVELPIKRIESSRPSLETMFLELMEE